MGIPSRWRNEKLGSLATQITKGTTPTTAGFQYQSDGIPFIKVENIIDGQVALKSVTQFISPKAHSSLKRSQFQKGDVLFSIAGTIGKTALVDETDVPANTNQAVAIIRGVTGCFIPSFLKLQLQEAAKRIQVDHARGGAMNNVSLTDLKGLTVSIPSLAEQKVIADKLYTQLAHVENNKARLERIPKILKRFRQSVLAAAVSGRLTEGWRAADKTEHFFRELLSRNHYISDADHLPVPPNWLFTAMGNVSTFQQGLQIAKSTRRMEPGKGILPILRTFNYENNFKEDVHYAAVNEKSIIAEPEDVILSRTGTVGLVLTGFRGIMHNNSFRLNFQKDLLFRRYLIYFLCSPLCQEYIKRESGRSSQPDLTHKAFSKCPITVPSQAEQIEIVRRVDQLFAHADRIEQQVNNALASVNNLTQSILAKAFRGELTEQWRKDNQELITGENSAEALLERIKTERPKKSSVKQSRKQARRELTDQ